MRIRGLFRAAESWSPEETRLFLREHHAEEYHLLDVSRPEDYRRGHLPGAIPAPLERLEELLADLDPGRPTIIYGGSAVRSLAAAALLIDAGFAKVHRMEGGVEGWKGRVATGGPEGVDLFAPARTPEEHAAAAWLLEEGTRRFYSTVSELVQDREARSLFRELALAEEHHKGTLVALYEGLTGRPAPADFPAGIVGMAPEADLMEGGREVSEALGSIEGRQVRDILSLAARFETNAYDRYLLLRLELPDENSRRIFEVLSDEEKRHLRKIDELLRHFV